MSLLSQNIAAIQVATTGQAIRSAIVSAFEGLEEEWPDFYSGAYSISPSEVGYFISCSNKMMSNDLFIEAYPSPSDLRIIASVHNTNLMYAVADIPADSILWFHQYDGSEQTDMHSINVSGTVIDTTFMSGVGSVFRIRLTDSEGFSIASDWTNE